MSQSLKVGVFDSEEDGLLETATKVWCVVVKDRGTGQVERFGPDKIEEALAVLQSFDVLIGHNIIEHDFPCFRKIHNWRYRGKVVDTLWMSRIQRPQRQSPPNCPNKVAPHSIEAWGYRLALHKVEHEDWSRFSPEMLHRCEQDVEINDLVYQELRKEGQGEGWAPCLKMTMKLLTLLEQQEHHGWMVDRAHMERSIAWLDRWILLIDRGTLSHLPLICEPLEGKEKGEFKYIKKPFLKNGKPSAASVAYYGADSDCVGGPFSRVTFRRVDLNSNQETKEFLLAAGWEPAEWNTNNAGERTSPKLSKDDPFDGVSGKLGRLIAKRVKCRHRKGTLEGLLAVIRQDGSISAGHSGFATTGRLKHRTIVNIPSVDSGSFYGKQMRACFIARDGKVIVGADSAGNQIRQLAARMEDEEFTRVVLFGKKETDDDLHSYNRKLSGVATRTLAKNFFYGLIFGAQDKKIGKVVGKDTAAGRELREGYLAKLPKLAQLIERLTEEWLLSAKCRWSNKWNKFEYYDGYITGLDGRPILVDTQHKILNYALQSDEAIQMAYAYLFVHEEMERRGYVWGEDWAMLTWYHDEYQAEVWPKLANELGEVMCWAIKEAGLYFNIKCPHKGDYKIGNNWADTH